MLQCPWNVSESDITVDQQAQTNLITAVLRKPRFETGRTGVIRNARQTQCSRLHRL